MFQVKHNITKKVDNSGSLRYFFDVLQRPKSALVVDITTELTDGTLHKSRIGVEPMSAQEKLLVKTRQAHQFGWFSVDVPGSEQQQAVAFTVEVRFGLLGHKYAKQQVKPSGRFEDVTLFENQMPEDL